MGAYVCLFAHGYAAVSPECGAMCPRADSVLVSPHAGTMVSMDSGRGALSAAESEVEPAACLALEMRYALDPNRQIRKRNKALQVRFKDICEAQSEQQAAPLPASQQGEPRREAKLLSQRAAYRKYMTVPARRSIPNVTRSTGVQTSPDLRKCYQTFPLERSSKRGALKGVPTAAEGFSGENNGFTVETREGTAEGPGAQARPWGAGPVYTTTALVLHTQDHGNALDTASGLNCTEPSAQPDGHSCQDPAFPHASQSPAHRPGAQDRATPTPDRETPGPGPSRVFKTEVASVYAKAPESTLANSAAASEWSLCPAGNEEQRRDTHVNGLQPPGGPAAACSPPQRCLSPECGEQPRQPGDRLPTGAELQQIVPQTEVVGLKAQLQVMENLICSSQETIKVLLGVIQELEKGEAHREG